jgi:hypothetical protein
MEVVGLGKKWGARGAHRASCAHPAWCRQIKPLVRVVTSVVHLGLTMTQPLPFLSSAPCTMTHMSAALCGGAHGRRVAHLVHLIFIQVEIGRKI